MGGTKANICKYAERDLSITDIWYIPLKIYRTKIQSIWSLQQIGKLEEEKDFCIVKCTALF